MSKWENNEEIQIFREYLKIPSVHPNINYEPCVEFLQKQAKSLDLPILVCYPAKERPSNPVVIITWKGLQPNLPSIMLNSHMDVVPVDEPRWTYPPFGAEMDQNGNIFARGAQDMKCCGTQYLAAIRALMKDGVRLQRTVHVTFVADEEIGSKFGMKEFAKSKEFKALNVGFEMDESIPSHLNNKVLVFYAERTHYTVELICTGQSGHGSILHENTAGEKLSYMINKLTELRNQAKQQLKNDPQLKREDVNSINLTMLGGGSQSNVVPAELRATFDIRLAVDVDHDKFDKQIKQWCDEAGGGINLKYYIKDPKIPATTCDSTNPFWLAFEKSISKLELSMEKCVCIGGTDARFIRELNIPAIGCSPLINTPMRLHDHDEFLNADIYLNGIKFYKEIITNLGNVIDQ